MPDRAILPVKLMRFFTTFFPSSNEIARGLNRNNKYRISLLFQNRRALRFRAKLENSAVITVISSFHPETHLGKSSPVSYKRSCVVRHGRGNFDRLQ